MKELLLVERTDQITHLTLNLPEKANALDAAIVEARLAAVDQACTDGTRLLVLSGAGNHFCAGFDFSDLETQSEGDLLWRFVRIEQVLQALWHAPLATVALVHVSLSRLWYAGPPMKGGTTDGQCTVHRCAGAPHGVPGFDEFDA